MEFFIVLLFFLGILGISLIYFVFNVLNRFYRKHSEFSRPLQISAWIVLIEGIIGLGIVYLNGMKMPDFYFLSTVLLLAIAALYFNNR